MQSQQNWCWDSSGVRFVKKGPGVFPQVMIVTYAGARCSKGDAIIADLVLESICGDESFMVESMNLSVSQYHV